MNSSQKQSQNSWKLLIILLVLILFVVVTGFKAERTLSWPLTAALMLFMIMAIGWFVNGRVAGVLINERNMMSLSRFQMVLWTLIVLSGYAAIAMNRAGGGLGTGALEITIPPNIWMLLGISSAALVGSPLMTSNKSKEVPTGILAGTERADMGILSVYENVQEASFTDLFKGEEIKNWNYVDVAKLQMFLFTVIVAIVYCIQLYQIIAHGDLSTKIEFPSIDEGMLTLMGISNAAYLGHKGIDQTPSKPKD